MFGKVEVDKYGVHTSMLVASAVLLVAVLILCVAASDDSDADTKVWQSGSCTVTLDGSGVMTVGSGSMDDYSMSGITPWYDYRDSVQKVVIADGVTHIGKYAFKNCTVLRAVSFETSELTEISDGVFYGCRSLESVTIPSSVTSIGFCTFSGCSSIKTVDIPAVTTEIGVYAFQNCTSLTFVSFTADSGLTTLGAYSFTGCSALTSFVIPSGVTWINTNTFCNCRSLESVTIPSGVTWIGHWSFYGCSSLKSVVIPASAQGIGPYAFSGCSSLSSVAFATDGNLSAISAYAFSGCSSIESLALPDYLVNINAFAFSGCTSLKSLVIPAGVTALGESAFADCPAVTELRFDAASCGDLTSSGAFASLGVSGTGVSVTFGSSVESIPANLFSVADGSQEANVASIDIPITVNSVGDSAFGSLVFKINGVVVPADSFFLAGHVFTKGSEGVMAADVHIPVPEHSGSIQVVPLAIIVVIMVVAIAGLVIVRREV